MKTNFVFFNTFLMAAPLAFWLQGSALAQAEARTNNAPAAQDDGNSGGGGRRLPPLRPMAAPTAWDNVEFFFPGGTPSEFLSAVEKQYKVDWKKVADIPDNMQNVHIPALRMNRQSADNLFGGGRGRARGGGGGGGGFGGVFGGGAAPDRNPLDALITLYNSLQQAKPELGNLMVEGDLAKPSVVIFHSSAPGRTSDVKMKAFDLDRIPKEKWHTLHEEMLRQLDVLAVNQGRHNERPPQIEIHEDTGLLFVIGNDSVLEAAQSIVSAWHANYLPLWQANNPGLNLK